MKDLAPAPSPSTLLALLISGLFAAPLHAQETTLDTVHVEAQPLPDEWPGPDRSVPRPLFRVGPEGMALFDSPGGSNPITAVAELPGVKVTTVDAYGLNNTQGGQKGIRVRGEVSSHGVSGTVEGLALGGPGPGPGYLFLFDKENVAAVTLEQGAIGADSGGLFSSYGALNTQLRWARDEARREISMGVGSDGFQRYFARIDTGTLSSGTALFVSASRTQADKWRGYGDAPEGRDNLEVGLNQALGAFKLKMIYARNDQAQHNYKTLNYEQARNLDQYRDEDYSRDRSSNDYYGYNRQDFRNQALVAELSYDFSPTTRLVFKPFWAQEEGYYLFAGSQPNQVLKWIIDHETYGASTELQTVLADTRIKLGYSWTSTEPPGPPTNRKQYKITGNGLQFAQWAMLSDVTERHEFEHYYLTGQRRFDRLTLQGGLRYAREKLPGIDAYNVGTATAGTSWDVSADQALEQASRNDSRSVSARSFGHWLPQLGAAYEFTPALSVFANLGRNIGAPSLGVFNQAPAGSYKTSQDYWDDIRPELSTSLDLGTRLRLGDFTLDPTLYYSRSRNKTVNVYSEDSKSVWSQNVGRTAGKGLLLAAAWTPSETLRVFGSFSYTRAWFTEDVRGNGGKALGVQGNQLPDVPRTMASLGAAWKTHGVTLAPVLQYVGSRWSTVDYREKVPSYVTVDLNLGYGQKTAWGTWDASLALLNAFDRKYIGQISTSEVNTTANGSIYYPGAPRTLAAKLAFTF